MLFASVSALFLNTILQRSRACSSIHLVIRGLRLGLKLQSSRNALQQTMSINVLASWYPRVIILDFCFPPAGPAFGLTLGGGFRQHTQHRQMSLRDTFTLYLVLQTLPPVANVTHDRSARYSSPTLRTREHKHAGHFTCTQRCNNPGLKDKTNRSRWDEILTSYLPCLVLDK